MPEGRELRLVMMGTGTFAEPTFRALLEGKYHVVGLVTQPDRAAGVQRGSTRQVGTGMKQIALEHGVAVLQPESINTPDGVAALQALRPDLLVVAAYGQILSKDVLGTAAQGGINVHASLLPRYRGAAPVAWAIYHGETVTGVTIIKMSVYLDAGDILAQAETGIGPAETAGELEGRLAVIGARLAVTVIDQIAAGTATGTKQDKTQATRAPKLTKEHGLIDWTRYAADVCRHIRAMQPWPTAYSYMHHQGQGPVRIIVHKASWWDAADRHDKETLKPGEVVNSAVAHGQLVVAAGDESRVVIQELQPAGKRRMTTAEFLRGRPLQPGDRFGPEAP
jgi:methionyl-tRNA formyltransferase